MYSISTSNRTRSVWALRYELVLFFSRTSLRARTHTHTQAVSQSRDVRPRSRRFAYGLSLGLETKRLGSTSTPKVPSRLRPERQLTVSDAVESMILGPGLQNISRFVIRLS